MAEHSYIVRGHWPFPLDMLRHDESRPASADDQAAIDSLSAEHATDRDAFKDIEIRLVGPCKPNTARWESFGWAVPGDEEYAYYKGLKHREAEEKALLESAMGKLTAQERAVVESRMRQAR